MGAALVTLFGVDAGSRNLREADHLVHDLMDRLGLPQGTVACTHLIRSDAAHVAVSVGVPGDVVDMLGSLVTLARQRNMGVAYGQTRLGPAELAAGAEAATTRHEDGKDGRAVVFPGAATLTGTVAVGALLANTAIDRVVVLGGQGESADSDLVQTRDHVRPEWRDGVLTLVTTQVREGVLAPFEVPNPTPCCADHG